MKQYSMFSCRLPSDVMTRFKNIVAHSDVYTCQDIVSHLVEEFVTTMEIENGGRYLDVHLRRGPKKGTK